MHVKLEEKNIMKGKIYNSLFVDMNNSLNKKKVVNQSSSFVPIPVKTKIAIPAQANSTTALPKTIQKSTQMLPSAVRSESAPKRFPATAAALLLAAPALPLLTSDAPGLAFAGTASVPVATPTVLLPVLAANVALPLTADAME